MSQFYLMSMMVLTVIVNIIIMMLMPLLKQFFNRIINVIKTELAKRRYYSKVEKNDKQLELEKRIDALEVKINKRFNNDRTYIQEQIKNVLIKLKEK